MKILYTTARFPYPPLRGDQLVPYARIQHLARKHEITLLSFVETPEEMDYVRHLKPYCAAVHTVPLPKWRSYAGMSMGALSSLPLQVLYYASGGYQRKLREILAKENFDVVHTVLSRPANHTMHVKGVVKVCEMIDAVSLTMKRRASAARWPLQSVWGMEAERMRRFEKRVCESFDGVVVVAEADRQELNAPNVTVVPVGADIDLRPRSTNGHKVVIFTGNFTYHSNEDAAIFLINEIWPQLRQAVPGARLRIVGNGPGPALQRVARQFPDVEVTGFVPDLRQQLLEADVAIAPMRLGGGGMHCKAIEAMACGTPLVVSSRVTGGVQGRPGEDFLLAADPPEYVRAVRSICENAGLATALSEKGRRLVAEKYSWEKTTQRLELLYEELLSRRSESGHHAHRN